MRRRARAAPARRTGWAGSAVAAFGEPGHGPAGPAAEGVVCSAARNAIDSGAAGSAGSHCRDVRLHAGRRRRGPAHRGSRTWPRASGRHDRRTRLTGLSRVQPRHAFRGEKKMKFCTACGEAVRGQRFCTGCGAVLRAQPGQAAGQFPTTAGPGPPDPGPARGAARPAWSSWDHPGQARTNPVSRRAGRPVPGGTRRNRLRLTAPWRHGPVLASQRRSLLLLTSRRRSPGSRRRGRP
jgi:hypothetical protein